MNRTIEIGKIKTSRTELIDITKAWLALSLAFTFVYAGVSLFGGTFSIGKLFSSQFGILFIISLFTAGLGFLLHELAHKFVAQRYGCVAEFRAFDQMLPCHGTGSALGCDFCCAWCCDDLWDDHQERKWSCKLGWTVNKLRLGDDFFRTFIYVSGMEIYFCHRF